MLETVSGVTAWGEEGTGIKWEETRDAGKHPTVHDSPTTENNPTQRQQCQG